MKYSMKEILKSYTPEKRKQSSIWARIFSRPLSFPLTYIFINLGISANLMSVISVVEVIIACIFILIGGKLLIPGVILYVLWHVLDCCDGNIARVKKTSSYAGEFFDAVSGYTAPAFIFLSVGVAAYRTTPFSDMAFWFIVLGAIASLSDILGRLIYQKYVVTEYRIGLINTEGNIDDTRNSSKIHLIDMCIRNMTYSSAFMPLLILAMIFNRYDLLILLFAAYNFLFLIASFTFFVRKARKLDEKVKKS